MTFQDLHEALRAEVERRIAAGNITGTSLARKTGFQQAHISNFLNRRRALSLEGLDKVLSAQNLSIEQILPLDLAAASASPGQADPLESVPIVSPATAIEEARITAAATVETIQISSARLYGNRPRTAPHRQQWQRFVALRLDAQQSAPMDPLFTPGSVAILDRHYNSLAPYRAQEPSVLAIRVGTELVLRYAELVDQQIVIRPRSLSYPIKLLPLRPGETPAPHVAGRICLTLCEL